jgi:glucokinase
MTGTAIGIDIGATRLKMAHVDAFGTILASAIVPTPQSGAGIEIVDRVAAEVRSFRELAVAKGFHPLGIGLDVPHLVDGPDWVQRWANTMPALEGLALRPLLEDRLGGELAIANDVNAFTIAEHKFGRGQGTDRLVLVAIGTGISIGVVADGEVLEYNWGTAGDTGHIIVDVDGLNECSCGGHGCLETVASGSGIRDELLRAVARGEGTVLAERLGRGETVTSRDVAEAARAGDPLCSRIFERAAFFLGVGLASYFHTYRPEIFVLAGGVVDSSDLLLDPMRDWLPRLASPARLSGFRGIELAAYPEMGAAVGSASLILFPRERATGLPSHEVAS